MAQTIEERIQQLEEKVSGLAAAQRAASPGARAWLQTFGLSRNDPGFREMVQLGRDYRRNPKKEDDGAHP